jgi:hypothetical protein
MHQQPWATGRSEMLRPPLDTIQLWLEKEDKEESKRIGELKEQQKKRQKLFEEQFKQQQERAPRMPSPSGFAEDETTT